MCGRVPLTYKKHTKLCIQYHKCLAYWPKPPGINIPENMQNILRVIRERKGVEKSGERGEGGKTKL